MQLGPYQLMAQLGAGRDGVAYRACDTRDQSPVEVRVLESARGDVDRWPARSRRLRQVALLHHPAALTVRELCLEGNPPYLAMEWAGESTLGRDETVPFSAVLAGVSSLASALAEAHRLGLIHGRLVPGVIRASRGGRLQVDFTRLQVYPPADSATAGSFAGPECIEGEGIEPANDVYSLGAILAWLLTGEKAPPSPGDPAIAEAWLRKAQAVCQVQPTLLVSLAELIHEMLASDLDARPSARLVGQRLDRMLNELGGASNGAGSAEDLTCQLPSSAVVPSPADWLPSKQLGRFRLFEKLGQGGMGTVYRAEDASDGSIVAVKVLRADLAQQPQALKRLQKEARLLARVNNPYVANLLEINEDQGVHYLAIEFVSGRNVRSLLNQLGRLDEAGALAILSDVARALLDAHERGIVHRDIKPENIVLVGEWPAAGPALPRAKLLDFGLARQVEQSESQQVTHAGDAVGTPFYMAPEQCLGKGDISPRCDVYAMGATLFHMLAGRPPFVGADSVGILLMHCSDPVPSLKQFNPQVSDGVCQVVEKALGQGARGSLRRRRRPAARFATAVARRADQHRRSSPAACLRPAAGPAVRLDLGAGSVAGRAVALRQQHRTAQPGGWPAGRPVHSAGRCEARRATLRPVSQGRPGQRLAGIPL